MNAVEIEEEVSKLAAEPFDAAEFPWAFLRAFGNKETAIKRLKAGAAKSSDISGGVLQQRHVHMAVAEPGRVDETLAMLKASPKTVKGRVRFVLATDGEQFAAHDLESDDPLSCPYAEFANRFGFFLPLAGISTVRQLKDNPIDIKATGRLNKLYLELIRENEEWGSDARRQDLNQFMARIIFCLFAEDTGIFFGESLFTQTIRQMSDASNTHEVIGEMFRAMDTSIDKRPAGDFRPWADQFPYVNGGLFAGVREVPRFSKMARSYLLSAGELDWKAINPDIFGSMIQGIADEGERLSLGMHYTSVPNILKVLDPLLLDDLREQLEQAADNPRKLLNLRKRIASIRVFDPACGSGNFLIVAYIKLREIEAEAIRRRKDDRKSWIQLTNFYGIDIKHFAVETARLSLLIAEFQCDARMIGQMEACSNVLPLHKTGQIRCGNALRMDWLEVCPPAVRMEQTAVDLFETTSDQAEIDFDAKEVETYICGNPPYAGSKFQSSSQRRDIELVFAQHAHDFRTLDYVTGWLFLSAQYSKHCKSRVAFVTTNSICQGEQVAALWPMLFSYGLKICFAHLSFKWANLAAHNAGVTCIVVGLGQRDNSPCKIIDGELARQVKRIGPYLVEMDELVVARASDPPAGRATMQFGNHPYYAGDLVLSEDEGRRLIADTPAIERFLRPLYGGKEFVSGSPRTCVWISDEEVQLAEAYPSIAALMEKVRQRRLAATNDAAAQKLALKPHRFRDQSGGYSHTLVMPRVTSENRPYLPVGLLGSRAVVQDQAFALYDAPLWNMSLIASRLHLVWIATVCGKLETRYRYSNTLGWNTFPVPLLTENSKAVLTGCAENILLAREAHYPATIADLYDPETMPDDLRRAHEANDEALERIYIGRRFRNDTERLEKLFDLYTKMTKKDAG